MKKTLSFLIALALLLGMPGAVLAETITDPSAGGSATVYGPLSSYASIGSTDWGTGVPAVVTWKHTSWPTISGSNAQWISNTEYISGNISGDTWRKYTTSRSLCTGAYNVNVSIVATADNAEEVYVNGTNVGGDGEVQGGFTDNQEWATLKTYTASLGTTNQVNVDFIIRNYAYNSTEPTQNPTGLIYETTINYSCPPTGQIIEPAVGATVAGIVTFKALYWDDDPLGVQWAIRRGTCAAGTNTVWGNVDSHNNPYTWDGHTFTTTPDTTSWIDGQYCFIFNPTEGTGEGDVRETQFNVVNNNRPPVVDANGPYTGSLEAPINIAGTASDPNGDALTYTWSINNAFCTIADTHALATSVTCKDVGNYTLSLLASDGKAAPVSDTASLTIGDPYLKKSVADCSYDTLTGYDYIETLFVSSVGAGTLTPIVTSQSLIASSTYKIVASGVYYAGGNATYDISADAQYTQDAFQRHNNLPWTDILHGYEGYGAGLLNLKVDGIVVNWGNFNQDHKYTLDKIGIGTPVSFQFQINDIYAQNNTGGLCVSLYKSTNQPPLADAGGPYEVNEGSSVPVNATGSDPDLTQVIFTWDLDNDGVFDDATGSSATFVGADGPSSPAVAVKVTDGAAMETTDTATVTVKNVAPTASFSATSPVDEGGSSILSLTAPYDPSSADTVAGFTYAFDCGNDSEYEQVGLLSSATCDFNDNGEKTVNGKIIDKDNGFTEYTAKVTVNNIAPSATFLATTPINEGESSTLSLDNPSDPSTADTEAGFTYAFDCGKGFGDPGSLNSASCGFDDNTNQIVKGKIFDKDGGVTEYSTIVTVNNVAPIATFSATSPIDEGGYSTLTLTDPIDPSNADTTAGFAYEFDCGDGLGFISAASNTVDCLFPDDPGSTVQGKIIDKDGDSTVYSADVTVKNIAPTVGLVTAPADPVKVGTSVEAAATFTDPGVKDWHYATFDWGDETTESIGVITEANGSGSVSGSHIYTVPGVYRITLEVCDKDEECGQSTFEYAVVYDPSAGFVTGGGWIMSPAGAYVADPALAGKATFGFVSKYQKGANIPTGNTEFQFKSGNLNFKSTSYEWLVVAGSKAQFKGIGTINGVGGYGFMLTANDGAPDKFRIKIWDISSESIVYDNQMDAEQTAELTTVLGGGSIVIHK